MSEDLGRLLSGGPGGGGGGGLSSLSPTDILIRVVIVCGLVFLAQTFTGLNIGLFALDCGQLQVLIDVPQNDPNAGAKAISDAIYAKRILPLRKKGNLLLCTILLANTIVNAVTAIFLADLAGGILGWLLTTLLIVYFGEILPQSICTRRGLFFGANGAPIIWLAVVLLYPITKIYAIVLDYLFPDQDSLRDRQGWREMIEYMRHTGGNTMPEEQSSMLLGALRLQTRSVRDVMIQTTQVFTLQVDDELSFDTVLNVQKSGFTRYPVYDKDKGEFVGLLHCKDLLREDLGVNCRRGVAMKVSKLLEALEIQGQTREIFQVPETMNLLDLLTEFKKGRPHLMVVCASTRPHLPYVKGKGDDGDQHAALSPTDGNTNGESKLEGSPDSDEPNKMTKISIDDIKLDVDAVPVKHVGIVTLHDVFQCIFEKKPDDEGAAPVRQKTFDERPIERSRRNLVQKGAIDLLDDRGISADPEKESLSEAEAMAVVAFLQATQPCFSIMHVSEEELLKLLRETPCTTRIKGTELYKRYERSGVAILILQGNVEVMSGSEGVVSMVGSWACLGMRNLEPPISLLHALRSSHGAKLLEHHDAHDYIPDFTANVVSQGARILCFTRRAYLQAYHRTQLDRIKRGSSKDREDGRSSTDS